MDIVNKHNIADKINVIRDNFNELLDKTLNVSHIYAIRQKLDFQKMVDTQYLPLVFEDELFNILLKNKYAIPRSSDSDEATLHYANSEYPFSMIICSKDAQRASILVNNVGIVVTKFLLYLRMLNQNVASASAPNSFLAVNTKALPFGRICLDIDYKVTPASEDDSMEVDDDYERFVERCFTIVCEHTTVGNVIMTKNCYTSNTRSFHLVTEQQFDATTRDLLLKKIATKISGLNANVTIDQVNVWMLPFGRGHVPVRRYTRQTNEFNQLAYPYTETDFELTMPFDLIQGTDNIFTLYDSANLAAGSDDAPLTEYEALYEYTGNNHLASSYHIDDQAAAAHMDLFVKILSMKYSFTFANLCNKYRYEHDYMTKVFGHRFNNFFLMTSNKKLLFENNWQIPKTRPKQRPTEPYEIYRYVQHRLGNGCNNMEELFSRMPTNLVKRNVNIGNADAQHNDDENKNNKLVGVKTKIKRRFNAGEDDDDFNIEPVRQQGDNGPEYEILPMGATHPWCYTLDGVGRTTAIATPETKNTHEYYRRTIVGNVYPYECCDDIMWIFENIQSMLDKKFVKRINDICSNILAGGDASKVQNYIVPLYEFFCRVHYIDACVTASEFAEIVNGMPANVPRIALSDEDLEAYRAKYVEMTPDHRVYRPFPKRGTPLATIWTKIKPIHRILLHTLYMMMVEHNYTSVFFFLHNVLKTKLLTQVVTCFLLNVIDCSYDDPVTKERVQDYASREFLNFIYKTFIEGGANMKCIFENSNVYFNMEKLKAYISDVQLLFVGSPIWFFLANFQYVDERMNYVTRFESFIFAFKQGLDAAGSNDQQQESAAAPAAAPPPPKQMKQSRSNSIFLAHDKYFKMYHIADGCQQDLLQIFFRYIIAFIGTENGDYIYDGTHFAVSTVPSNNAIKPMAVRDPVKYSPVYRHQYGIYNTWTLQMERHTPMLYTHIHISNAEFSKHPHLCNAYNDDIYRIMVNRLLKSITFTRVLNFQKNLGLLLAPIYDPNVETNVRVLNYNIDSIQINIHDLSSSSFVLPEGMLVDILKTNNKLYEMFKWLYCIICHYSENYSCVITTPSTFIPKCMLPDVGGGTGGDADKSDESAYSMFQQQFGDINTAARTDENRGDKLLQRLYKILEKKEQGQRENITDKLYELSQREITSLITLFNNTFTCEHNEEDAAATDYDNDDDNNNNDNNNDDNDDAPPPNEANEINDNDDDDTMPSANKKRNIKRPAATHVVSTQDTICKFNLSTCRGSGGGDGIVNVMDFFESDEFMENSKSKLLMSLFNRKLDPEIRLMSIEDFEKVIDDNHSQHIVKFTLLILSWFIRTLHPHMFGETTFFRELQQNRQLLYDQLSELVFRHNGYFMYNNSISDIYDIFSTYCRNISLEVDAAFEMANTGVDLADLYLGYDAELEGRVPSEIIRDIEQGCVSNIYQGQFIEDTFMDWTRLWARVTDPRNRHRISPLLYLHTATGKSEKLIEICRRLINNIFLNNIVDPTSLMTNERGTDMAREMNGNLVMCVEELTQLNEKFKQLCGHSSITYKPLWADAKVSFQNNATLILSTNNDPKCKEEAVLARLHVYPRRIQYATVKKTLKFQRNTMCASTSMLTINNIMAVQMIMEKMPRVVCENYHGNFMMIWLMKRFFLFNIIDPVTVQASETLQTHNNNFHNMINAQAMVLERLEMNTTSTISLIDFRKLVNRICDENRQLFHSKIDTYNIYTILTDKLQHMIDNEAQTIRVCEKNSK